MYHSVQANASASKEEVAGEVGVEVNLESR